MVKIGPKEAQRRALRESTVHNELALLGGHDPGSSELPPAEIRRLQKFYEKHKKRSRKAMREWRARQKAAKK
jgi:hypothetical protein